jgi:DDE superfamily endonuclease
MEGRPMDVDWQTDLDRRLAPFVAALRHKTRARMCPAYIAGLIGPRNRKSIQPMATRAGEIGYDQLHRFVAAGVWDSAPLEAALLKKAGGLVGDKAAFLVVDDTALPKKGSRSAGVRPQYASSLGKTANCQSLVSPTLASREVPVMVGLRLFLPESWTDDPGRTARAYVPKDKQTALTKPEIALEEMRPRHRLRCPFWLCASRFRIRLQRAFPPGIERTPSAVGSKAVTAPERLSRRRFIDLLRCEGRKASQIPHSGFPPDRC